MTNTIIDYPDMTLDMKNAALQKQMATAVIDASDELPQWQEQQVNGEPLLGDGSPVRHVHREPNTRA